MLASAYLRANNLTCWRIDAAVQRAECIFHAVSSLERLTGNQKQRQNRGANQSGDGAVDGSVSHVPTAIDQETEAESWSLPPMGRECPCGERWRSKWERKPRLAPLPREATAEKNGRASQERRGRGQVKTRKQWRTWEPCTPFRHGFVPPTTFSTKYHEPSGKSNAPSPEQARLGGDDSLRGR